MSYLIETKKGTKGVIESEVKGKYLCYKLDENYNITDEKFAVLVENCKVVGFIDKTKTYAKKNGK